MTTNDLLSAKTKLKTGYVGDNLCSREDKFHEVEALLVDRLEIRQTSNERRARVDAGAVADIDRHANNALFVCGVPGSGKTSLVMKVVEMLQVRYTIENSLLKQFKYYYVNGQQITTPDRIYSEIYYKITGKNTGPEKAQELLDMLFYSQKKASNGSRNDASYLVIIDELDLLFNEARIHVFYNLFDWPTSSYSKFILISIENAMDLPERLARGRICSRMGWDKIIFEPYKAEHLESILEAHLGETLMKKCFDQNAIRVATKSVGKTTGDARRILDTCSLAIDEAIAQGSPKVTAKIIDNVGFKNLDRMKMDYIRNFRPLELLILKSILKETESQGEMNVTAHGVYKQVQHSLLNSGIEPLMGIVLDHDEFHSYLNLMMAVGLICLEGTKNLMEKHLFIKDTSESSNDVIRFTKISVVS